MPVLVPAPEPERARAASPQGQSWGATSSARGDAVPRGAGSVRAGTRYSGVVRRVVVLRCVTELGAAGATAGGGAASDLWKMPSWLNPVTAAVIDPTSAAVAVRYPGAV